MKACFFILLLASAMVTASGQPRQEWKGERVLFVGNSITMHGPKPEIGWTGNWGMAASAAEADYVHLVVGAVAKMRGKQPAFKAVNIADFERDYEGFEVAVKMKEEIAFDADTVIVGIGENVPALATEEAVAKFKDAMVRLLKTLKASGRNALYVRSTFMADAAKDAVMKEACALAGGVFIDVSELAKEESNYARSERKIEHAGVGGHPGDRGMRAIADAIVAAMKN